MKSGCGLGEVKYTPWLIIPLTCASVLLPVDHPDCQSWWLELTLFINRRTYVAMCQYLFIFELFHYLNLTKLLILMDAAEGLV